MTEPNVTVHVFFNCGCGFSTEQLEAAIKHAHEKQHTLTANGEIRFHPTSA